MLSSSSEKSVGRGLSLLIGFLAVPAIYLYAYPQANIFYAGVVLLHAVAGIVATVWLLIWLARILFLRQVELLVRIGMMCYSIANVKSTMGQADFYLEY